MLLTLLLWCPGPCCICEPAARTHSPAIVLPSVHSFIFSGLFFFSCLPSSKGFPQEKKTKQTGPNELIGTCVFLSDKFSIFPNTTERDIRRNCDAMRCWGRDHVVQGERSTFHREDGHGTRQERILMVVVRSFCHSNSDTYLTQTQKDYCCTRDGEDRRRGREGKRGVPRLFHQGTIYPGRGCSSRLVTSSIERREKAALLQQLSPDAAPLLFVCKWRWS